MIARLPRVALITSIAVAPLWAGWRSLCAITSPMLLINQDPTASFLVDGRRMEFKKGICNILPWKSRYLVEVRSKRGTERRNVYPLAPESDSASVVVEKKGTTFNVKNEAVD